MRRCFAVLSLVVVLAGAFFMIGGFATIEVGAYESKTRSMTAEESQAIFQEAVKMLFTGVGIAGIGLVIAAYSRRHTRRELAG